MPKSPMLRAVLVLAGCCILGTLSVIRNPEGTEGAGVYPLGLLTLVLLQVSGARLWAVGVLATAATAATMWGLGQSPVESVGYAVGGVVAAFAALRLLRAHTGRFRLRAESDLMRIAAASLSGATIVAASVMAAGTVAGVDDLGTLLVASFLNQAASLLLWLPLVLPRRVDPPLARLPERILQWTVMVAVSAAVFSSTSLPTFAYLVMVVVGWAGLRFALIETLVQLIVLRLIAVSLTAQDRGPFSEASHGVDLPPDLQVAYVQLFLIACSVAVVTLSLSSTRTRWITHQEALERAGAEADIKLQPVVAALEAERTALEELREVDRVKDAVISTVSHELRTPITNIIGYTELLDDGDFGDLSVRQSDALERIGENGQRLLSLIDDLLTLSRLRTEQIQVRQDRVDLVEVVRAAERSLLPRLRVAGLSLEMDLGTAPLLVLGDQEKLERAVLNLMSNAVKFTPEPGRVTVALRGDDQWAEITVSDTGYGISPDDLDRLFAQFFRTTDAQERHIQGTGLGLSIVRAIVEGHGGEVAVESTVDVGTTFRVRLQRA